MAVSTAPDTAHGVLVALLTTMMMGLLGLLFASCSGWDSSVTVPADSVVVIPATSPSASDAAIETTTMAPSSVLPAPVHPDQFDPSGLGLRLEEVARLDEPIALTFRPGDDGLFVAQRDGLVVRVGSGGEIEPFVDLRGEVGQAKEQGLLGVTFSPDGDLLYLSYSERDGTSAIDEWAVAGVAPGSGVDEASRRKVIRVSQPFANHNGGAVVFGPDAMLYFALGDGGSGGDPRETGQDTSDLLGSILRIAPTGADPYAVPADNPFVDVEGARPEIWTYGLRNPWRFSFDRRTGDLWIGDVGQDRVEEIDVLPAASGWGRGANLGWDDAEGSLAFEGLGAGPDQVPPVHEYAHSQGCSVTGGYVYRGSLIPDLDGVYVYGDYCEAALRWLLIDEGGEQRSEGLLGLDVPGGALSSFGEGPDGELYMLSLTSGVVSRLTSR